MNIIFISNLYPAYPGQTRSEMTYALHDFTKEWIKQGHNVRVFTLWDIYPRIFNIFSDFAKRKQLYAQEEEFELDDVPIMRIPTQKIPHCPYIEKELKKVGVKILTILKRYHIIPDIIVAHGLYPAQIAMEIKSEFRIPMVLGLHNTDRFRIEKNRFPKIINQILNTADSLVFRSPAIQKSMQKTIPEIVNQKPNFVAFSGIDESMILSEHELNQKIRTQKKNLTFITACKLIPLKNIDILIQAFETLQGNSAELIIIGDGPERKKLEKLKKESPMSHKIRLLGELPREQVLEYLQKADFFVMASKPETFGLVYLEAMANGCIPIGTKGEGIDGVIRNGYNGFLCDPNVQELPPKLQYLFSMDNKIRAEFIRNTIETVKEYSTGSMATKYLNFLQEDVELGKGYDE